MGVLAFSILATMFIIHFILCSCWIGLVGLNSVFPDYSIKDSAYSEIYTKRMSDIIEKRLMRLFIPIFDNELHHFEQACGIQKPKNPLKEDNTEMQGVWKDYLSCDQQHHFVAIDGSPITVEFVKYDHPKTRQFGILGYIDLAGQARGQHQLKIVKNGANAVSKEWTIPFYYHGNL